MSFSSGEMFGFADRRRTVFDGDSMSIRAFILLLSGLIAAGLGAAAFIASFTYTMQPNWLWVVGYFVVVIPGVLMSAKSDNWFISLIGYVLVIAATGALIGPYTSLYTPASVLQVALITLGATLGIGLAGALYPKSVEHWSGFLLMALLVLIVGDLARAYMTSIGMAPSTLQFWDWIAVLIFSAYIFYDMNRAMRMEYTVDNAVDMAVSLYLDIINLFLRLLSVMGKRSSSD